MPFDLALHSNEQPPCQFGMYAGFAAIEDACFVPAAIFSGVRPRWIFGGSRAAMVSEMRMWCRAGVDD
jgi:hypothetical protein